MPNLTTQQIENIQIDYGLVYMDYGEATQQLLGPTKGGAEFSATKNIRDIEYDGALGKSKGMQVIDAINAMLKFGLMDTSLEMLALALPQADLAAGVISNGIGGVIAASKYLTNITMFAKTVGGDYKKITLFNAMNEADFVLAAGPKAEGVVNLEVHAHWDPTDVSAGSLYTIEDVETITADVTPPSVTTSPLDAAVGVVVSDDLTATFNEAIREGDITTNNFILIKASDGSIVAGTLTYNAGTKTATFNPTENLGASTAYIWTIARVRDVAGNMMTPEAVNFTTA